MARAAVFVAAGLLLAGVGARPRRRAAELLHAAEVLRCQTSRVSSSKPAENTSSSRRHRRPNLPWPAFTVDGYVATLDYARAAVHAKYHRVQVQEPGRERPHAEATMDQYAVDGMSWNLAPGPTAIPTNLRGTQRGAVGVAAGLHQGRARESCRVDPAAEQGVHVSFTLGQAALSKAASIACGRSRCGCAPTWIRHVLGDTPIEFRYGDYRDFERRAISGAHRPPRRRICRGTTSTVSAVRINIGGAIAVPAEVAANPVPSDEQGRGLRARARRVPVRRWFAQQRGRRAERAASSSSRRRSTKSVRSR